MFTFGQRIGFVMGAKLLLQRGYFSVFNVGGFVTFVLRASPAEATCRAAVLIPMGVSFQLGVQSHNTHETLWSLAVTRES